MVKKLIFIVFAIVSSGCRDKEDECPWPHPELVYYISDTSSRWFEAASNLTLLRASSNMGRNQSYDVRWSARNEYLTDVARVECRTNVGEHRYLEYTSSLYGHNFFLEIGKHGYDDLFIIRRSNYEYGSYTINTKSSELCTLKGFGYSARDTTIPVLWFNTMTVGSKTFQNVFKIDIYDKKYSFDETTRIMYFTTRDGIIKFETFDGEIWSLY